MRSFKNLIASLKIQLCYNYSMRKKNYLFYLLIIISITCLDLFSKKLIADNFKLYESKTIIDNFFYLTFVYNEGAGFSILRGQFIFFYLITIGVLIFLAYIMYKHKGLLAYSAAIIFGGSLGNFIERLLNKRVIDMFEFRFFNYTFPIFNISDIFICLGGFMLILYLIMEEINAKRN